MQTETYGNSEQGTENTNEKRTIRRLLDFAGQTVTFDGIFECGKQYKQFGLPTADGESIVFVYQNTSSGDQLKTMFDNLKESLYALTLSNIKGEGKYRHVSITRIEKVSDRTEAKQAEIIGF